MDPDWKQVERKQITEVLLPVVDFEAEGLGEFDMNQLIPKNQKIVVIVMRGS